MMKNKKYIYRMAVMAVVILAFSGTFLPGWLLVWQSKEEMNMVDAVPVEYYSPANLAVARNASANLEVYQKLQLITGRWQSNSSQADSYERQMENYEAVELARQGTDKLFRMGVYPVSLMSDYENWFSWEAEFCKVVDATFHTYAAYYWKISFVKYDGSERHQIHMLEDGTIFLADAWKKDGIESNAVSRVSENGISLSWGKTEIIGQEVPKDNQSLGEYFAFTDIETTDLQWMELTQLQVNDKEYLIIQADSAKRYLFSLQPWDETE